jgi:hypothetical protein
MRFRDYGSAALLIVTLAMAMPSALHAQDAPFPLPLTHTVTLTAVAVDAQNWTATPPCAAPTWTSSDVAKATVAAQVNSAAFTALVTPVAAGAVTITVTCGSLHQDYALRVVGPAVALMVVPGVPALKGP